jgi:hypothetical protein
MREKPIFEEVSKQLVSQPQFWVKLLIGGGLSFIPFINIFAFGFLYRFSVQLRRTGKISLPEWNDWAGLFSDGLKFGLIWIVYWALPMALAIMLSIMFLALGLQMLAYLVISAIFFVASTLFCSALYRFHMHPDYKTLLEVGYIVRMSYVGFEAYVLPIFVFAGIFVLALPLYGVAFFAGFLLLITQLNSCYRSFELRK